MKIFAHCWGSGARLSYLHEQQVFQTNSGLHSKIDMCVRWLSASLMQDQLKQRFCIFSQHWDLNPRTFRLNTALPLPLLHVYLTLIDSFCSKDSHLAPGQEAVYEIDSLVTGLLNQSANAQESRCETASKMT